MRSDFADMRRRTATSDDAVELERLATADDLGVVCLVAGSRATSAAVVASLAQHPADCVRRVVARRADLAADLIEQLALDPSRHVRRATHITHELAVSTLVELRRRGWWSPRLEDRLRRVLDDPMATAALVRDPATVTLACGGVLDRETVRNELHQLPDWSVRMLANTCRFDGRSAVALARNPDRLVQESLASNPHLTNSMRRRIVRLGGVWASAAALGDAPGTALRSLARFRSHRVVRRRAARFERNRLVLSFWARQPDWDVARALAANPRLPLHVQRRLARRASFWSVREALARRTDVSRIVNVLGASAPVQFALASNPAAPADVVGGLGTVRDPYVRGLAESHPTTPPERVRALLADPEQPAWLLRRLASHPSLTDDERDIALSWITLGGCVGDPTFDPVMCTGSPNPESSASDAYDAELRLNGLESVLWRARARAGRGPLGNHRLFELAHDPHPGVRSVAASYLLADTLAELRWDEIPAVSQRAQTTAAQSGVRALLTPPPIGRRPWWLLAAVPFGLWLVTVLVEPAQRPDPPYYVPTSEAPTEDVGASKPGASSDLTGLTDLLSRYPGRLLDSCWLDGVLVTTRDDGGLLITLDVVDEWNRIVKVDDLEPQAIAVRQTAVIPLAVGEAKHVVKIAPQDEATRLETIELSLVHATGSIDGSGCA